MMRWAFGYLAIAVVVAIGFASLQDGAQPEGRSVSAATKHGTKNLRGGRAHESYSDHAGERDYDPDLEHVIESAAGGHFLVEAVVNGAPVDFLVDTGASDIVLTMEDAQRLGLQPATLRFTQRFATANGEVRGAPVVLREIRIGQFSVFDVPASVNEAPLGVSLLGMSFLKRLNGYAVENDRLILRW